jgi:hypothetical protein
MAPMLAVPTVLLFLAASLQVLQRGATTRAAPAEIFCRPPTPPSGKEKARIQNPIAEALSRAGPGTTIFLAPGDYPAFTIGFQSHSPANAATSGGERGRPIVVQGQGPGVRVVGREGDTIAIDQRVPNGWITFRNLTIVPGKRAGVMFYQRKDGRLHEGYVFEDCHILGEFERARGKGRRTRWGVWGQMLADFRFAGVEGPARIENISDEHAFYLQNVQGSITIENVHAKDLGRTFCQFTARALEGPPARGDVTVRNCRIADACIAQMDGYKGGSAFTLSGRSECTFVFEGNVYEAGFAQGSQSFTLAGQPYGTGAFAAWEETRAGPNGTLILRDNRFVFAPGCGDRPVVSIGGCRRVLVLGANEFVSGGTQPALALDPADASGRTLSSRNGSVYLAPATRLGGALTLRGGVPTAEERLQLARLELPDETAPAEVEEERDRAPEGR